MAGDLDAVVSFYPQMDDEEYGRLDMISDHPIDERLMKNLHVSWPRCCTRIRPAAAPAPAADGRVAPSSPGNCTTSSPRPSYLKIQATLLALLAKGAKTEAAMEQIDEDPAMPIPSCANCSAPSASIGDANLGEAIAAVMLEQLKPQTHADIGLQYGPGRTPTGSGAAHPHPAADPGEAVLTPSSMPARGTLTLL